MSTSMSMREGIPGDLSPAGDLHVADNGDIHFTVDLPASPERVFRALASGEITDWGVRPGVFDTREWTGDVRPGGRWRAAGMSRGEPYTAAGEYLEVEPSRRLVHTWDEASGPNRGPTTLTYALERLAGGTRLMLRQYGFAAPLACENFAAGWLSSFERLAEILADERMRALRGRPSRAGAGAGA